MDIIIKDINLVSYVYKKRLFPKMYNSIIDNINKDDSVNGFQISKTSPRLWLLSIWLCMGGGTKHDIKDEIKCPNRNDTYYVYCFEGENGEIVKRVGEMIIHEGIVYTSILCKQPLFTQELTNELFDNIYKASSKYVKNPFSMENTAFQFNDVRVDLCSCHKLSADTSIDAILARYEELKTDHSECIL